MSSERARGGRPHRCETGEDRPRPRMARERRPRSSRHPQGWCGGRGTGAVKATGSYEGSLSVEGTSDRHEPVPVTGSRSRRSRRLPHVGASDGAKAPKRRIAKATQLSTEEEEATGVSEARSIPSTVGRQSPRSQQRPPARTAKRRGRRQKPVVFGTVRRSGRGWREPPLPPVLPRGARDSVGCPRSESCGSEPGTHEVRVHGIS